MKQVNHGTTDPGAEKAPTGKPNGFSRFFTSRVVVGIVLGVVALWGFWFLLGSFEGPGTSHVSEYETGGLSHDTEEADSVASFHGDEPSTAIHGDSFPHEVASGHGLLTEARVSHDKEAPSGHGTGSVQGGASDQGVSHGEKVSPEHALQHGPDVSLEPKAQGVHFVAATIAPLDYELNERFWGWRRNDLLRFTDNVENIQLGVLEVARRASVNLMERISRHGVSASIDKNLENAMNWFMIKPDSYWLPSSEQKYNESLEELRIYAGKLERGVAHFYVRADNLIPLLLSFADLAGSCDENLVKTAEDDGSPVSWFMADDYFYYAKGVAMAMEQILHAVREDFSSVLEARHVVDLLHHAAHACHVAANLDPWLVTDASLDGILANHRANMAAEISHVRYFLNALAKALAT